MGKKNKSTSWRDFKIGKSFSARDIARAQEAGFSENDILRMGATAGSVKNSANKALSGFNQGYVTPLTGSMYQPNSGRTVTTRGVGQNQLFKNKNAKRILTWNGLNADGSANALTINKPNGSPWGMFGANQSSGEPYGQWTSKAGARARLSTGGIGSGDGGDASSSPLSIGGGGGSGSSSSSDISANTSSGVPFTGVDSLVSDSVTSFRRKKSKAKSSGLTSKGTSQFKISGQSSSSSGLNIGM